MKNHPALPWREIGGFMALLRERESVAARAIEFAIVMACRSGEVRGATWAEIDKKAGRRLLFLRLPLSNYRFIMRFDFL